MISETKKEEQGEEKRRQAGWGPLRRFTCTTRDKLRTCVNVLLRHLLPAVTGAVVCVLRDARKGRILLFYTDAALQNVYNVVPDQLTTNF